MNQELYLKRFFIETYNDESMYYDYLRGEVYLNYELFNKWAKETEQRNKLFAYSMEDHNRLKNKSFVESKLSDEYCISKHLHINCTGTISEFGKFDIKKYELGDSNSHYICNGYFIDTLENIYKVLEKGSFTVGICAEKKTDLFRDVVEHYGKLRSFLLNNGYQTAALQVNVNSKNRVYLFMYNHLTGKRR